MPGVCSTDSFSLPVSLKFGVCYITGQWGEFRANNNTSCLHCYMCTFFIKKIVFLSYSFLFLMNYQKPVPEMYASENFVAVNDFLAFRHKIRKSFKLHRVDNSYIQRDIPFYYRINRGYNLGLYSDFTIIIIIIIIIIIFI